MNFIIKLLKFKKSIIEFKYNLIMIIVNRFIKKAYFVSFHEEMKVKKIIYLFITLSAFSVQFLSWWNSVVYSKCQFNYCSFLCSIEWWNHILLKFQLIMSVIHSTFLLSWSIVDSCDLTWWLFDILFLVNKFFIISML